jgi:hypothetical protein
MLSSRNVFTIDIIAPQEADIYGWVKNTLKPLLKREFNLSVIGDGGLQSVSIDFVCKPYPPQKTPQQLLNMLTISTIAITPAFWGIEWHHWTYDETE